MRLLFLFVASAMAAVTSAQLTLTVVPVTHNGYHISCFGARNGAIDLSASGGTPPYTYVWTTGATTEDVSGLAAGYCAVEVTDAASISARAEITLTQPLALSYSATVPVYPNGYNVSCHQCFNGSINFAAQQGVAPYAYLWDDGPTTQNRTVLGAVARNVTITDANGCTLKSETFRLSEPARTDWTMTGNAGTIPSMQYLGTSDNKDLVLKTNNSERLRLQANGALKVSGFSGGGILKAGDDGTLSLIPVTHTPMPLDPLPFWSTTGNYTTTTNDIDEVLGTRDANPLKVITHNTERMRLTATGRLGLGTTMPNEKFEVHHADQRGGMLLNNNLPDNAHSEIRFAGGGTQRWALGCDLAAEGDQDFFLWDEASSQIRLYVKDNGRIGMGTTDPKGALHVRSAGPTKAVVSASTAEDAGSWVYNSLFGYGLSVDGSGRGRIMYNFNAPETAISLTTNGKVGIGLDPPGSGSLYRLYVEGGIACRDVLVTITQFQDVVFKSEYELMPLSDLRTYLARNGHLPTMPKGSDVEAAGGMEVGDLQMRLLRTVEDRRCTSYNCRTSWRA